MINLSVIILSTQQSNSRLLSTVSSQRPQRKIISIASLCVRSADDRASGVNFCSHIKTYASRVQISTYQIVPPRWQAAQI